MTKNHLTRSHVHETAWICKSCLGIHPSFPFVARYQEHFHRHVFYGAPSTLLVSEIPGCILFPGALQCYFTALEACRQTPEIVNSDGEWGINLSGTLGKTNLWWGMGEAPRHTGQQKTSAEGKHPAQDSTYCCSGLGEGSTYSGSSLRSPALPKTSTSALAPRFWARCLGSAWRGTRAGATPPAHPYSLSSLLFPRCARWFAPKSNSGQCDFPEVRCTRQGPLQVLSPKISSVGIF